MENYSTIMFPAQPYLLQLLYIQVQTLNTEISTKVVYIAHKAYGFGLIFKGTPFSLKNVQCAYNLYKAICQIVCMIVFL